MEKIDIIESAAILVPVDNIDTDQIIPARFLKTTVREGFGEKLFYDWRHNPDGTPSDSDPLAGRKCSILVAGNNFGCGSSREPARYNQRTRSTPRRTAHLQSCCPSAEHARDPRKRAMPETYNPAPK